MTIAAIYARKSTDQSHVTDEQRSVARQVDHARTFAARKGWDVSDDLVYVDDGIGGAEFDGRPGLQRLLRALVPAPSFQVLIVSEMSRLGREQIETQGVLKRLALAGVRVFLYLEDREVVISNPLEKAHVALSAMADEMERERARQRTYDAMHRKALAAHVTGGRCFGYRNVDVQGGTDAHGRPIRSHVTREIVEAEAVVVRRIFQLYADGYGLARIAKRLNADGAPSPRAQQGRPKAWAPSSVREILHRPLYRGEIVWNQSRKRNTWGQIKPSNRPAGEWVRVPVPALRIVDDKLWTAAHERLGHARREYLRATNGKLWGKPTQGGESKHLLPGFAKCGLCGHGVFAHSRSHGRHRATFYGCTGYHKRGATVCGNRRELSREVADAALVEEIRVQVLNPRIVEQAVTLAIERLRPALAGEEDQRRALEADARALQTEIDRLVEAVAAGGSVQALTDGLRAREARKAAMDAEIARLAQRAALERVDWGTVRERLEARVNDWRGLLAANVSHARQLLRKLLVGPIRLTPTGPDQRMYRFEATVSVGKLLSGLLPTSVASPTGFEPVF